MITSSVALNKSSRKATQKIAQTREEREAAFGLIYQSYLRAGLCEPNQLGLRISPYQLSTCSEMFVTVVDQEIVATISLFTDSCTGLPMELLYPQQVNEARHNNLLMGEISCLADRRKDYRRIISNLCELTRLMTQYARFRNLDGVMLISHPKHARFYKRFMAFESIGPIKPYCEVKNNLAEPLRFDFNNLDSLSSDCYQRIFGEPIPEQHLTPCPISAEDRNYFARKMDAIKQPEIAEPIIDKMVG